jgi:Ca2+-binding EF-hand superfamily protein
MTFYFQKKDTFKAYDRDGDSKISRKEFIDFIEESWKAAFIILGDTVNKFNLNAPINV